MERSIEIAIFSMLWCQPYKYFSIFCSSLAHISQLTLIMYPFFCNIISSTWLTLHYVQKQRKLFQNRWRVTTHIIGRNLQTNFSCSYIGKLKVESYFMIEICEHNNWNCEPQTIFNIKPPATLCWTKNNPFKRQINDRWYSNKNEIK